MHFVVKVWRKLTGPTFSLALHIHGDLLINTLLLQLQKVHHRMAGYNSEENGTGSKQEIYMEMLECSFEHFNGIIMVL